METPLENMETPETGAVLQLWEVQVEVGVERRGGLVKLQVTPGANCMQQIYLEGAEGSVSRMSQLFK